MGKDVEVIKGRSLDHLDDLDILDYLNTTATLDRYGVTVTWPVMPSRACGSHW